MTSIIIPQEYNYIGCFITFACNLRCSYCINHQYGAKQKYQHLTSGQWIDGLNRIETRPDLPITFQGGEPTQYKNLYAILHNLKPGLPIDILTNGQFNEREFALMVNPKKVSRNAKYANIRISYHPQQMSLQETIDKVKFLMDSGFSVGVWVVEHPGYKGLVHASRDIMLDSGIDCRLKEFLGEWHGKFYGTYKYPHAVNSPNRTVMCRSSEMLIAPDGSIHRCHSSLYSCGTGYSSILADTVELLNEHMICNKCGQCNSCDIKLKTNRHQEFGHCSVDIR